jgi:hypothetical protein
VDGDRQRLRRRAGEAAGGGERADLRQLGGRAGVGRGSERFLGACRTRVEPAAAIAAGQPVPKTSAGARSWTLA